MRYIFFCLLLSFSGFAAENFTLVKESSSFKFKAYMTILGIASGVDGKFDKFDISATKDLMLEKSSVILNIDASSIDTDNTRRDKHLK